MGKKKTPDQRLAGNQVKTTVRLATRIGEIRKSNPGRYRRIMRKLAELERRRDEVEQRSIS